MAYLSILSEEQCLYINQQDTQTLLTLSKQNSGQQQSQTIRLDTGIWTIPPILFRTSLGLILQIESNQGKTFALIQASQIQVLTAPPLLVDADLLPLQKVEDSSPFVQFLKPMSPMPPMNPMPPMTMGNMTMQMNPMQMTMGDRTLQMGNKTGATSSHSPELSPRFCSQCGQGLKESDRFCSHCGWACK